MEARGRWACLWKGHTRDPCVGGLLYLDYEAYTYNKTIYNKMHTNTTHTHPMITCKTGEVWIRSEDYISVNILAVILHCSFTRHYLWRKVDKGYTRALCIISYKCMPIYKYPEIKSLITKKRWKAKLKTVVGSALVTGFKQGVALPDKQALPTVAGSANSRWLCKHPQTAINSCRWHRKVQCPVQGESL